MTEDLFHRTTLYIGGRYRPGRGPRVNVTSPVTEQIAGHTATGNREDIDLAVNAARHAIDNGPWPRLDPSERAAYLEKLTTLYQGQQAMIAALIRRQNGAPAAHTAQTDDPLRILTAVTGYTQLPGAFGSPGDGFGTRHEPVGVVAVVLSAEMPQRVLMARVAPALLAGCAVVVKPAPETPLDALYLADLMHQIGIPAGVFNVIPLDRIISTEEYLVTHPGVDMVAFSGGRAAGARISYLCSPEFRRVSLECGSRSTAVITLTADLDTCTQQLAALALTCAGQQPSATTRLLVHEKVELELTERLRMMLRSLAVGDPDDKETQIGPLLSSRRRQRVLEYVRMGRESGCHLAAGHTQPTDRRGFYMNPVLFTGVDADSPVARHHIPGPLLTVSTYRSDAEALTMANSLRFGHTTAVFSNDPAQADYLTDRLRCGVVSLNGAEVPAHAPVGGVKHSGIGRHPGVEALRGYQEVKTVARVRQHRPRST